VSFFLFLPDYSPLELARTLQDFEITASGVKVTYEMLKLALDQYCLAVAK
jgi:hypothetical protein